MFTYLRVCGRRPTGHSRANTLPSASLLPHVFFDLLSFVSLLFLSLLSFLFFVLLPVLFLDVLLVDRVFKSNDVPLVEFMYLVFSRMSGDSYCRRLRSVFVCVTSFDRQLTPLFVDSLKTNSFFLLVFLVLLLRLWRGIMD